MTTSGIVFSIILEAKHVCAGLQIDHQFLQKLAKHRHSDISACAQELAEDLNTQQISEQL